MDYQKFKLYAALNLAILLGIFLIQKSCQLNALKNKPSTHKTDTVIISKPYEVIKIQKEYLEKPVKVYVYKRDTIFRKEKENSTIITAVNIKESGFLKPITTIKIDKIDTMGILYRDEFRYLKPREIKIDHLGNLQIKQRHNITNRSLKIFGIVSISAIGGYFIYRQFK